MSDEYTKYPRGAEWRKWDLHVHTPYSVLNNGFGADWDEYVTKLFRTAIEKEIFAIGVTDYFSINGYKKIKEEYLNSNKKMTELFNAAEISKINDILLLPNIEFRLDKFVGDNRVNFHIIFSEELTIDQIEEDFLHSLKFVYEADPQEADKKKTLNTRNLTSLGQRLKKEHTNFKNQSDLYTGMMNAVISDSDISDILAQNTTLFKGRHLICIPSDEDLSSVGWNNQAHLTRKNLIQKSDALFTSNSKSVQWALGKYNDSADEYIEEFKSLKPCIWGSDAHKYSELFCPDKNRFLWIKADLNFRGLYAIKHEPASRVAIQELNPNQKTGYKVIERIERYKTQDDLEPFQVIPLNPNLNCIIGGRSTGKSVLAKSIAYRMDSKDTGLENEKQDYQDWFTSEAEKIRVIWTGDSEESEREVEYYRQSFMYDVARDDSRRNGLVQNILEQHGKSQFIEEHSQKEKEISEDIHKLISNLFLQLDKLDTTKVNLIQLGEEDGVEKELIKLKSELSLNGGHNLTKAELLYLSSGGS